MVFRHVKSTWASVLAFKGTLHKYITTQTQSNTYWRPNTERFRDNFTIETFIISRGFRQNMSRDGGLSEPATWDILKCSLRGTTRSVTFQSTETGKIHLIPLCLWTSQSTWIPHTYTAFDGLFDSQTPTAPHPLNGIVHQLIEED